MLRDAQLCAEIRASRGLSSTAARRWLVGDGGLVGGRGVRYNAAIEKGFAMTLGAWLARNDLSEAEAARLLGMAQSALNRITFKRLPPNLRNAAKIVRGTGGEVTYEDLLGPDARKKLRTYNGRLRRHARRVSVAA